MSSNLPYRKRTMENTILLVDDEPDIREVLNLSLSDLGYRVFEAENGDTALRLFKEVASSHRADRH